MSITPYISAFISRNKEFVKKNLRKTIFPSDTEFEISIGERCSKCEGYIGLDGDLGSKVLCTKCTTPSLKARKYRSDMVEQLQKETSLEIRLFVGLQMDDYDNWNNGEYKGDINKIREQVKWIIKDVREWIKDGMPRKE